MKRILSVIAFVTAGFAVSTPALADELNAAPIQHIGKLLVLWRPMPEKEKKVNEDRMPGRRQTSWRMPSSGDVCLGRDRWKGIYRDRNHPQVVRAAPRPDRRHRTGRDAALDDRSPARCRVFEIRASMAGS